MTAAPVPTGLVSGLDLLQRALDYTRDALARITDQPPERRAPERIEGRRRLNRAFIMEMNIGNDRNGNLFNDFSQR